MHNIEKVFELIKKTYSKILLQKNISFSSVESFTGGAFSKKIVSFPRASNFFKGSLVAYSNESKRKIGIDLSQGIINKYVTTELALFGKKYFNSDFCFSFNGNAGPTQMDNKEKGLFYIGINDLVFEFHINQSRSEIIEFATNWAYEIVKKIQKAS